MTILESMVKQLVELKQASLEPEILNPYFDLIFYRYIKAKNIDSDKDIKELIKKVINLPAFYFHTIRDEITKYIQELTENLINTEVTEINNLTDLSIKYPMLIYTESDFAKYIDSFINAERPEEAGTLKLQFTILEKTLDFYVVNDKYTREKLRIIMNLIPITNDLGSLMRTALLYITDYLDENLDDMTLLKPLYEQIGDPITLVQYSVVAANFKQDLEQVLNTKFEELIDSFF